MYDFKTNNKLIRLNDDQFLLIKQISNLGFVSKTQLNMLYSIIVNKQTSISSRVISKLVRNTILERISTNDKHNKADQAVYVIGRTGRAFLSLYKCFFRNPYSFSINSHNLQANETLIQSLYAACFKHLALGMNNVTVIQDLQHTYAVDALNQTFTLPNFKYSRDLNALNNESQYLYRLNFEALNKLPTHSRLALLQDTLTISGAKRGSTENKSKNVQSVTGEKAIEDVFSELDGGDFSLSRGAGRESTLDSNDMFHILYGFSRILLNPLNFKYINIEYLLRISYVISNVKSNFMLDNNDFLSDNVVFSSIYPGWFKSLYMYYQHLLYILSTYPNVLPLSLQSASLNQKNKLSNRIPNSTLIKNKGLTDIPLESKKFPLLIYKPQDEVPFKVDNDLNNQTNATYSMLNKSERHFNLQDFDTRPFNAQLGLIVTNKSSNTDSPFEADTMISFFRGSKQQRVFIELDNRTENNRTQIQKIANYIYYASQNPDENILVAIVSTDGSLPSKKVNGFKYPDQHLNIMADSILKTGFGKPTKMKSLKHEYLDKLHNLKIIIAGVSEAPKRIAEFIINANHNAEYYGSALNLANRISEQTQWNVKFEPVPSVQEALKNGNAFLDNGYDRFHYDLPKIFGYYSYSNDDNTLNLLQPVIAGDEYDLDTLDAIRSSTSAYNKDKPLETGDLIPPIVIYPIREDKRHPLVLPSFKHLCNWSKDFILGQIYYYQPRLGIDNNPYLHLELRKLLDRHAKDIHRYFTRGYLSKFDEKKDVKYGDTFIPIQHPQLLKQPRSYQELHKLANKMNYKEFTKQVMLTEIPRSIYKKLIERNQGGEFSILAIADLPYASASSEDLTIEDHVDLDNCLTTPNKVNTATRIHVHLQ